jgi:hypothetical protein
VSFLPPKLAVAGEAVAMESFETTIEDEVGESSGEADGDEGVEEEHEEEEGKEAAVGEREELMSTESCFFFEGLEGLDLDLGERIGSGV